MFLETEPYLPQLGRFLDPIAQKGGKWAYLACSHLRIEKYISFSISD
jgi:hypothetical protein